MATNKVIFTGLEAANWQEGLKWVRTVKQAGVKVAVIDMGLEESHVDKLNELDVDIIPNSKKAGVAQVDLFNSFIPYAEQNPGKYVFWDSSVQTDGITALWGVWTFAAVKSNMDNVASLVYPLTAIDARVKLGRRLEIEVVDEYGGTLYGNLLAGTLDGWKMFVGFYNTLVETGTIEPTFPSRELAVNLFALYFREWVEAKPVSHQVMALQPEKMG